MIIQEQVYVPAARLGAPSRLILILLVTCVAMYLSVAILVPAPNPTSGLDPSWRLGLSLAFENHLVFGRDVIFTYGPLGFLLNGSLTAISWLPIEAFHLGVALGLVLAAIWRSRVLPTFVAQLLFVAVVILAATGLECEFQLLFFVMIIATAPVFARDFRPSVAAGLGLAAAFCCLAKFSLAIDVIAATFLLIAGAIAFIPDERIPAIRGGCFWLASFLWGVPFLYALAQGMWLAVAFGLAVAALIIVVRGSSPRRVGAMIVSALAFATTVALVEPAFGAYLQTSYDIVNGYSSAMSILGEPDFRRTALLFAFIFGVAVMTTRSVDPNVALALCFVGYSSFKYAFVRQDDGHVLYFFVTLTFASALLFVGTDRLRASARFGVIMIVFSLATMLLQHRTWGFWTLSALLPSNVFQQLETMKEKPPRILDIPRDRLPAPVLAAIGRSGVDVEPWEVAAIAANDLRWAPLPEFQSYAAYTPVLDRLNDQHVERLPPPFVIFSWLSIDNRFPSADEPTTFQRFLCEFRPSNLPAFTVDGFPAMLLIHTGNVCGTPVAAGAWSGSSSASIPIPLHPEQSLLLASISLSQTSFGVFKRIAFRSDPLLMRLTFENGTTTVVRVVPDQMRGPFIIDPAPISFADFRQVVLGRPVPRLSSIRLLPADAAEFSGTVFVKFSTRSFGGPAARL